MTADEQLLPISALQHLMFCERQCALIHVERLWVENRLTIEGRHLHERAHEGDDEHRADVTVARGMPLRSLELGLFGVADVVELYPIANGGDRDSRRQPVSNSPAEPAFGRVLPIEYKRGRPKKDDSDRVQLCAQSVCLEEMLGVSIEVAYLFYGKRKRRTEVAIDDSLRQTTKSAALRLHEMINRRETPRAIREPKCDNCSLVELCLPNGTAPTCDLQKQFSSRLARALASDGPMQDCDFDSFG